MNEIEQSSTLVEKRQKQTGLWIAGIFAVISLAFAGFLLVNLFVNQQGRADFSDKTMTPVILLMFFVSVISYFLIRRGRLLPGIWLLIIGGLLIPPIFAVMVMKGIAVVAVFYIITLTALVVTAVLPKASRLPAIIAAGGVILAIGGIELWNPAYRVGSSLGDFATVITVLGALGIIALSVRQALVGNIFTKLVTAFVLMAVISVAVVAFLAQRSLQTSLTTNIGSNLSELANARGYEIGMAIDREKDVLEVLSLSPTIRAAAQASTDSTPLSQEEILRRDQEWQAADAANNNADPLIAATLNNAISDELRFFQEQFTQHVEVFLTNVQGVSIATTNRTSDYLQADEEWWQLTSQNDLYVGQPEYDPSTRTIAINMAVTLRDNVSGNIIGILRTTVNFTTLTDTLALGLFGTTGRTNVLLPSGKELKLNVKADGTRELVEEDAPPEIAALAQSTQKYQEASLNGTPILSSAAAVKSLGDTEEDTAATASLNWRVVALQDQSEALQPVSTQTRNIIILSVVIIIVVAFAAFALARVISAPLTRLNAVAGKVAAGDLTVEAKVETKDEIGTLATTFNSMVTQLRTLIGTLEQRVADRTKALATSTEVSRSLSTILDEKQLVVEVVEQVKNAFNYYHAHIYFYDPAGENLVMAGGTGEAGQTLLASGHKIAKGKGLVGRAAETNQPILVPDTSQDPNWLPNKLLPDTKAEVAVPISIGDQVMGVLDVQHNIVNGLTNQDVDLLQSIANQVATSIQNVRSYEQTRKIAANLGVVADLGIATSNITDVKQLLQQVVDMSKTAFGLYHAHIYMLNEARDTLVLTSGAGEVGQQMVAEERKIPLDSEKSLVARAARTQAGVTVNDVSADPDFLPNPLLPNTRSELAVPMIVGGNVIGVFDVQSEQVNRFTETDIDIQTTLASQVATAVQNARSFSQSQIQMKRETSLNLITQKIQSATTIEAALQITARELGHALGMKSTLVALDPAELAGEHKGK